MTNLNAYLKNKPALVEKLDAIFQMADNKPAISIDLLTVLTNLLNKYQEGTDD